MAYPTKYARQYDFLTYQNANPTRPLPGDKVNIDLNYVVTSVDEIVEFLKLFTSSAGAITNASIGRDQLSADILALIDAANGSTIDADEVTYDNAVSGLAATDVQAAIDEVVAASGAISSVFGRTGAVTAAASDYDASQVDNDSGVTGTYVSDALDTLDTAVSGKLSDVVGDVTPQLGGALDGQGYDLNNMGVVFLTEQAAAEADVAGKGQMWVETATPNVLRFTDDAGSDWTPAMKEDLASTANGLGAALIGIEDSGALITATTVEGALAENRAAIDAIEADYLTSASIGSTVQAYDAELAALAGLTSAADKVPYFTGSGTAAVADLSSFGRTLIDDASASAARTTLGVVIGTDVQAYDAVLADLAGLTLSQGDILYFNGSNLTRLAAGTSGDFLKTQGAAANPVWATIPGGGDLLSTNNLSDVANAGTSRTNLGLAIGTDVQAYDAELAALAGLTSAADKVPYFTGSGTAAVADLSSFGRTLIDDANAATARATLGLGTVAILAEGTSAEWRSNTADRGLSTDQVWGAAAEVTLVDGASIAVDMSSFINAVVTLGGNRTLANPTNEKVGQQGVIRVVQDATGSRTLSFGTDYEFAGGTAPTLTTTANAEDLLFYHVIATNRVFIANALDIS